jgi:hypothetical protein
VSQPRDLNRRPSVLARAFRWPGTLAWISARKQLGSGIQVALDHSGQTWIRARSAGHVLDGTPLGSKARLIGQTATLRRKDSATLTIYLHQKRSPTKPARKSRRG